MDDYIKLEVALLQLQRAVLIDTQTLFRLLIDKGICSTEDIVNLSEIIASNNPDVSILDSRITELTGKAIQKPNIFMYNDQLLDQLEQIKQELMSNFTKLNSDRGDSDG